MVVKSPRTGMCTSPCFKRRGIAPSDFCLCKGKEGSGEKLGNGHVTRSGSVYAWPGGLARRSGPARPAGRPVEGNPLVATARCWLGSQGLDARIVAKRRGEELLPRRAHSRDCSDGSVRWLTDADVGTPTKSVTDLLVRATDNRGSRSALRLDDVAQATAITLLGRRPPVPSPTQPSPQ